MAMTKTERQHTVFTQKRDCSSIVLFALILATLLNGSIPLNSHPYHTHAIKMTRPQFAALAAV